MSTAEERAHQAAWAWVRGHYGRQGLPWREACVDSYLAGHSAATTVASTALERANGLLRRALDRSREDCARVLMESGTADCDEYRDAVQFRRELAAYFGHVLLGDLLGEPTPDATTPDSPKGRP